MRAVKFIVFGLFLLFFSCSTTKKLYETGDYDGVVEKLGQKAANGKLNAEQIEVLANSYHGANEKDYDRIMDLKMTGQPNIWPEIYKRTLSIDQRQEKISDLSEDIKVAIGYKSLDLDEEINSTKEKAEIFLCAKSYHLLKTPTEENIEEARGLVDQLFKINPTNRNLDDLRVKLIIMPSERILFRVATPRELFLPEDFARLVLDFEHNKIYNVPFDIVPIDTSDYDLMIRVMIEDKFVGPERIETVSFEERNGDLVAKVTDKILTKSATIYGRFEFIDVKKDRILLVTPFDVSTEFAYDYAEVSGDKSACSEHTLELLKNKPVDFPSDTMLLRDVARKLNSIIKEYYQKK